jgi:hypothetical protein
MVEIHGLQHNLTRQSLSQEWDMVREKLTADQIQTETGFRADRWLPGQGMKYSGRAFFGGNTIPQIILTEDDGTYSVWGKKRQA